MIWITPSQKDTAPEILETLWLADSRFANRGMKEKSKEFLEKGVEAYAKE